VQKCGLDVTIDDFSGKKNINLVGGSTDILHGGFNTYSQINSQLTLNAKKSSSWWYSILSKKCFDVSAYRQPFLYISILGPANGKLTVQLQQKDERCIARLSDPNATVSIPISTTGSKIKKILPLSWFEELGVDSGYLHAVSLINFTPNKNYIIFKIGFGSDVCETSSTNPRISYSVSILVAWSLLFIINNV